MQKAWLWQSRNVYIICPKHQSLLSYQKKNRLHRQISDDRWAVSHPLPPSLSVWHLILEVCFTRCIYHSICISNTWIFEHRPRIWMFFRVHIRYLNILVNTQHLNILTTCTLTLCVWTEYMYTQYLDVVQHLHQYTCDGSGCVTQYVWDTCVDLSPG